MSTAAGDAVDPINSDDTSQLRREILRLRDESRGGAAREDVLRDRIATGEARIQELDAHANDLAQELARGPLMRLGRAVVRRFTS